MHCWSNWTANATAKTLFEPPIKTTAVIGGPIKPDLPHIHAGADGTYYVGQRSAVEAMGNGPHAQVAALWMLANKTGLVTAAAVGRKTRVKIMRSEILCRRVLKKSRVANLCVCLSRMSEIFRYATSLKNWINVERTGTEKNFQRFTCTKIWIKKSNGDSFPVYNAPQWPKLAFR